MDDDKFFRSFVDNRRGFASPSIDDKEPNHKLEEDLESVMPESSRIDGNAVDELLDELLWTAWKKGRNPISRVTQTRRHSRRDVFRTVMMISLWLWLRGLSYETAKLRIMSDRFRRRAVALMQPNTGAERRLRGSTGFLESIQNVFRFWIVYLLIFWQKNCTRSVRLPRSRRGRILRPARGADQLPSILLNRIIENGEASCRDDQL